MAEIRSLLGEPGPYSTFNREERNCVAMLYHVLLSGPDATNLSRFVELFGWTGGASWDNYELTVEWSYLRDVWQGITDNTTRRAVIERALDIEGAYGSLSIAEFNTRFGATPKPSTTTIQSPATWNLARMAEAITDDGELRAACMLKWAFRIKPDLVISGSGNRVMCVEAKWESGEGSYPATGEEHAILAARGIKGARQLEVQRFLLRDLLDLDATFGYLVRTPPAGVTIEEITVSWRQAFESLDLSTTPPFIRNWVATL